MRIAWFAPAAGTPPRPADDTASLVAELAHDHEIELFCLPERLHGVPSEPERLHDVPREPEHLSGAPHEPERLHSQAHQPERLRGVPHEHEPVSGVPGARPAHDFVWRHARRRFDVCVYELADSAGAAFVWPYLLHYPGIVRLRSLTHRHRGRQLQHEHRAADSAAEAAFGVGRIPLLAARLAVVADPVLAGRLQDRYPEARVRHAPIGVDAVKANGHPAAVPMVAVTATTHADAVHRAAARARAAGTALAVRIDADARAAARDADIVVALPWPPPDEPPVAALLAMAAGRPAIVHETALTAAWPALDPQTWQPRGIIPHGDPVVVSIDPRDEEHSLMLALRRLAAEPALRARLGAAAHAWWRTNATPVVAAAAWRPLLEEAATLLPPTRPPGWPAHLQADGTERTRAILAEFGVSVDFLDARPQG